MIPGIVAGIAVEAVVPPTPWTPADTTTQLWYDFGDSGTVTAIASAVSQITDKSGNGRTLAQSITGRRPVYSATGLNGLGIASFDGSDDSLEKTTSSPGLVQGIGAATAFVLRKFDVSPTSNQFMLLISSGGGSARLTLEGGRTATMPGASGRRLDANSIQALAGSTTITTGWALQAAEFDWASATLSLYINGAMDATTASFQTAGNTSNTAPSRVLLGAFNSSDMTEFFDGSLAEIIVVPSVDDDLRQRIEGYMLWRWGLESLLPAGHPYESAPPTI